MYADRVEIGGKGSIKDRLNGNSVEVSDWRQITGKRQRSDDNDKWEHDLYMDNELRVSNNNIGLGDLRLKLQGTANQSANGYHSDTRDLREKLSGVTYQQTVKDDIQKPKPKTIVPQVFKPAQKDAFVQNPEPEAKRLASAAQRKKSHQKTESIDSFLRSLGLQKYSITFQVEEVDMTALMHMKDADLKALGVPMNEESIDHILLHCDLAKSMWTLLQNLLHFHWDTPPNVADFWVKWIDWSSSNNIASDWKQIPLIMWWTIWKERNRRVFEGKSYGFARLKGFMLHAFASIRKRGVCTGWEFFDLIDT